MNVLDLFDNRLATLQQGHSPDSALPERVCGAVVAALGADGAGLSLVADIRVPLGWDGPEAQLLEEIQFTQGSGPCLDAAMDGQLVRADAETLGTRWPRFAQTMVERTRYRSVASVPLFSGREIWGAADVYWADPDGATGLDIEVARRLAERITTVLLEQVPTPDDSSPPNWLLGPGPQTRMRLWTALGLVSASLTITSTEALMLMQGYANDRGLTLDELTDRLVARRMTPADLRG